MSHYVDGVSLTYGMSPRHHIWTFTATIPQPRGTGCDSCTNFRPSFVCSDLSCNIISLCDVPDQPLPCQFPELWSGGQCFGGDTFYRNLTQTTSENLEMRICRDEDTSNEDVYITFIEIFVSAP